jgi:hypothetical protein
MADIIVTSIGTGDSRALNVSAADVFCAAALRRACANPKQKINAQSRAAIHLRRIVIIFLSNARALLLENANFNFAEIIRGLTCQFKFRLSLRL